MARDDRQLEADGRGGPDPMGMAYTELVRRFNRELEWKDALEGKAVTFLGFVGLYLAFLVTLPAGGAGGGVLALPAALQIGSAFPLMRVIYGHSIAAGPAPIRLLDLGRRTGSQFLDTMGRCIVSSTLANRRTHSVALFSFQVAVVLAGVALAQLAISVAARSADPEQSGLAWAGQWIVWLPGCTLAALLTWLIHQSWKRYERHLRETIIEWEARMAQEEGGDPDGPAVEGS